MKLLLTVLLLIFATTSSATLTIDPFEGPKPLAVLIQTNPWLMIIGSDTPLIAIYEDGQVIYLRREKNGRSRYVQKQLSPQKLETVKKELSAFADMSQLKSHYDLAPNVFDLPETQLYLNLKGSELFTRVYGLMLAETKLLASFTVPSKEKSEPLPEALKELHHYLTSMSFDDAKEWVPKYVEVMISPYERAPDESIHWPEDWPGLHSPYTLKRRDAYSIFLPGDKIPQLGDFLKTRKPKGAVKIGGKKWGISARYTFPSEPMWSRVFRRSEQSENEEPNKPDASDIK